MVFGEIQERYGGGLAWAKASDRFERRLQPGVHVGQLGSCGRQVQAAFSWCFLADKEDKEARPCAV